jgi:hypothetical protein
MTLVSRLLPLPFLLVLGCSGSGGGASGTFVIVSCSLGCTTGGCSINQIAENQEIVLEFNRPVDPASVGPDTFNVVKAVPGGAAPPGTWVTQGKKAIFRPLLSFGSMGSIVFGFEENAPYQITVPGAPSGTVIRSTAGSPNRTAISCVVTASQGVNDYVPGSPHVAVFYQSDPFNPSALVPLADATCVPRGLPDPDLPQPPGIVPAPVRIVFVFDDIMQPESLVDPLLQSSETLRVRVRQFDPGPPVDESTTIVPGTFTISYDFTALRTRVVFAPTVLYPGLGFAPTAGGCIPPFPGGETLRQMEVELSPAIFDVSGSTTTPPNPLVLAPNQDPVVFTTKPAEASTFTLTEDFETTAREDASRTGALWNDPSAPGVLKIGKGGGRGLLGDVRLGEDDVIIDTGSQTFPHPELPGTHTLTGAPITVTNGIFEFESIRIPQGRKLTFVGPNVARIFVRGNLDVQGTLDLTGKPGPDVLTFNDAAQGGFPQHPTGGAGGAGGPGAGAGGEGGDIDPNVQATFPATQFWSSTAILDGQPGGGVGGSTGPGNGAAPGAVHYPDNLPPPGSLAGWICPVTIFCKSQQKGSGGGGGGYKTPGSSGAQGTFPYPPPGTPCVLGTGTPPVIPWPPLASPGGSAVVADPTLNPDLGFLLGGSGGGGTGVNPHETRPQLGAVCTPASVNVVPPETVVYQTGCGGGGGGGGGQVQVGRDATFQAPGLIDASGGRGGSSLSATSTIPGTGAGSGGGGGSGGAVLLQVAREITLPASTSIALRVKGGAGGPNTVTQATGGAGGDGYVRVETDPAPPLGTFTNFVDPIASLTVGTYVPFTGSAANFSGATSNWIPTAGSGSLIVTYDHYTLKAAFGNPATPPANVQNCSDPLVTCTDFDDDPGTPNGPLLPGVHPVQIFFQGAPADESGETPNEELAGEWVTTLAALNANDPAARFVRFAIVFDQALATTGPPPLLLAVLEVKLFLNAE